MPWTARWVSRLAWAEALGTAAYAVVFTLGVLPLRDPWLQRAGFAAGVVVLVLVGAAVLAAAARAIAGLRHWARSFLVVAQLMGLAVGVPMARAGDAVGVAVVVAAVVGLVLLLHPATTAALDQPAAGFLGS